MRIRAIAVLTMSVLCACGGLRAAAGDNALYMLGVALDQHGGVTGGWTRVGAKGDWKKTVAGAVLKDRLYSTETSGVLYETDLATGNWKPIGKPEFGHTAFLFAANDALYSLETGGSLYRVNPANGGRRVIGPPAAWKKTVSGTIHAGRLYTATSNGALYETDLATGSRKQIGRPAFGDTVSLLSENASLYTIGTDGSLYRVNLRDGSRVPVGPARGWKRAKARVGYHNQLFTAESDGGLYVSNLTTGVRTSLGEREYGNTRFMFAANEELYTIEADGSLYRVFLKPGGGIDAYDWCTEEIEKVFREQGKAFYPRFKARQINGAQATHAGVLEGFDWLQKSAAKDDLVVVYVGCHGSTEPDQGWGVVTADGKMLWGRELKTALGKLPCQVLLMVETCSSGGFALPHKNDIPIPPNVTALCACTAAQTTDNQLDIAVAEGLYGRADFNKDGSVCVDELIGYIKRRYLEWWPNPTDTDGSQTPVIVKAPNIPGALSLTSVSPALAAIAHQGTLWSALLEGQDDSGYRVHLLGWSSRPGRRYFLTDRVTRDSICLPGEGVPLLVERAGKWHPARLLTQTDDKFKIRYLGMNQDETVTSDRIKYPFAGQTTK